MKKILAGIVIVIVVLVTYFGIANKELLSVTRYFSKMNDIDFKVEYSIIQEDSMLDFWKNGILTGELRGAKGDEFGVHGYLYLEEEDVPLMEYYENKEDAKYNISQLCIFMIEKIGSTTGLSLDWIVNAVDDFYVAKSQLEQITGVEISHVFANTKINSFAFEKYKEPIESYFGERISNMKFYQYSNVIIGIPAKFQDGSTIYVKFDNEVEMVITLNEVKNGEPIQMPEGQLSEKQVETIKWIYEKFAKLSK